MAKNILMAQNGSDMEVAEMAAKVVVVLLALNKLLELLFQLFPWWNQKLNFEDFSTPDQSCLTSY